MLTGLRPLFRPLLLFPPPAIGRPQDNQSVDRAYRIGQSRDVVVYRLVTCGTVEEKIYRKQVSEVKGRRNDGRRAGETRRCTSPRAVPASGSECPTPGLLLPPRPARASQSSAACPPCLPAPARTSPARTSPARTSPARKGLQGRPQPHRHAGGRPAAVLHPSGASRAVQNNARWPRHERNAAATVPHAPPAARGRGPRRACRRRRCGRGGAAGAAANGRG
jgi:hypothetical protein